MKAIRSGKELGKVGQRGNGEVAGNADHAPAEHLQPHGMLVITHDGLFVAAKQHAQKGDRQDQTVDGARQNDHALCAAEDRHNERGEGNEADDEPLFVLGNKRVGGLEEGNGGIRRADDGRDTGGEQRYAEQAVTNVAGSETEGLGGGVGGAGDSRDIFSHDRSAGRADAKHAEEQQDTDRAGDTDTGEDGFAEVFDFILAAAVAGIQQTVRAGEGDVAAAGAAEQRDHDGDEILGIFRGEDVNDRVADGGLGHERNDQHDDDDDAAEDLRNSVHDALGILGKEDADGQHTADDNAGLFGNADRGIKAECHAADIADVERETADDDQDNEEIAETGEHLVGDLLTAQAGCADDGPDVGLRDHIHDDDTDDNAGKRGEVLCSKLGSLGQEAGSDGGSRHQECCAEHNG